MPRPLEPPRSLHRMERLLVYHDLLVRDRIRNRAFRRALARRVVPGSNVLDIGSGTGLWAVEAARLGARRVVAVEKEPLLVPLIERLAADHGVADRVHVVGGDSRRITLPREFDLLVSETVGNLAFDEGILPLVADARKRFLRPGAGVVPAAITLAAAPVHEGWRPPLRADGFRDLARHIPREPGRRRVRLLASPRPLARVGLEAGRPEVDLGRLRARWRIPDAAALDAFLVWVEMDLARGVRLSSRSGTTWSPALYGVETLGRGPARAEFELSLAGKESRWRLALASARGVEARSYSPLFAYGALRSRASNSRR
jgi:SAM-dependent methyltransferase